MLDEVITLSDRLERLPMDDLSCLYLLYLANLDCCPHTPGGFKKRPQSPEVCMRSKCRVFKQADGFCAYASSMGLRVGIFLKRAATGLAALRAARTLRHVKNACAGSEAAAGDTVDALQNFAGCREHGEGLRAAVATRYLSHLTTSIDEIMALLPMATSGKRCLVDEFVVKRHGGDNWQALRHYGRETYSWMEAFFRDNSAIFADLQGGNGAIDRLRERLAHAEKFTDPFIRHVLEPFLDKIESSRPPEHIEADMARRKAIGAVVSLVTTAAMPGRTVGAS